jgi:ABC-2 type transport system ATP-binding protein
MTQSILKIENLHKKYGHVHAVNNLSIEIFKGNVYGILGPNGSGKSTTLGVVLNVVNKTSGEFSWFGGNYSPSEAQKKIGAIIERPNFYPYMSAYDNLKLVCKIKSIPYDKIIEKLEIVGLHERRDDKFRGFSLGMKQRLAIASALLNDPEILILDEPTNGLDPQGIRQIRDIIKLIASQGTTILLASHLLDEVEKVCSHVIVLQKGKTLYQGLVDGITANNGFFELQANDLNALKNQLQQFDNIDKAEIIDDKVFAYPKSDLDGAFLNRTLQEKNITLTHLVKRKQSLEEQFLELTK